LFCKVIKSETSTVLKGKQIRQGMEKSFVWARFTCESTFGHMEHYITTTLQVYFYPLLFHTPRRQCALIFFRILKTFPPWQPLHSASIHHMKQVVAILACVVATYRQWTNIISFHIFENITPLRGFG
jgi:hypothetical protein